MIIKLYNWYIWGMSQSFWAMKYIDCASLALILFFFNTRFRKSYIRENERHLLLPVLSADKYLEKLRNILHILWIYRLVLWILVPPKWSLFWILHFLWITYVLVHLLVNKYSKLIWAQNKRLYSFSATYSMNVQSVWLQCVWRQAEQKKFLAAADSLLEQSDQPLLILKERKEKRMEMRIIDNVSNGHNFTIGWKKNWSMFCKVSWLQKIYWFSERKCPHIIQAWSAMTGWATWLFCQLKHR